MKDEEIVELYWQRSELAISRTKAAYGKLIRKIAGYSDMPEVTVKTILHRTRLKLKEYLEQQGYSI